MTKDEALDLALEALEKSLPRLAPYGEQDWLDSKAAITAIKQARALDKMADNARELGLDYEPSGGTQVSKVWWDGEKLMAELISLEDVYRPAPVQEPVAWMHVQGKYEEPSLFQLDNDELDCGWKQYPLYTTLPAQPAPVQEQIESAKQIWREDQQHIAELSAEIDRLTAAQRQWVGLTDEEAHEAIGLAGVELLELAKMWSDNKIHVYQFDNEARKIIKAVLSRAFEAKLKEKNT